MTTSPEFPNQELGDIEYGPKPLKVETLLEIFKEEGRGPKFEECFKLWQERMQGIADRSNVPAEGSMIRLEKLMFEAQIYLEIGEIDKAAEVLDDIQLMTVNDHTLEYDDSKEKRDLYQDIRHLDDAVSSAWRNKQDNKAGEDQE